MTMTTASGCHPSVAPLAFILATNDSLADRSFQGVADGDEWKRPTPQTNPMLWILGHMVQTRVALLKLLGDEFDTGWGDLFARGSALVEDAERYPAREAVQNMAQALNARLYGRLATLTDDELSKPASRAFTPAVKTLADQISFLTMHDTYHVGQLGYVRKALGLPGVVG
jgi:uncharacterized damage-inducible protein DinB